MNYQVSFFTGCVYAYSRISSQMTHRTNRKYFTDGRAICVNNIVFIVNDCVENVRVERKQPG